MLRFARAAFGKTLGFFVTLAVLGLSLLPLSALLLAYPAVNPQESVLTDAVPARRSFLRSFPRRMLALLAGLVTLIALLVVSVRGGQQPPHLRPRAHPPAARTRVVPGGVADAPVRPGRREAARPAAQAG